MARTRRTWLQLRGEIRRLIREEDETAPYITNAMLLDMWNRATDKWTMVLGQQHEGWNKEILTTPLIANQGVYTLPEGYDRIIRIVWMDSEQDYEIPLGRDERYQSSVFHAEGATGTGVLPTYRLVANTIVLEPRPRDPQNSTLKIEMEAMPAQFVDDTSTLDLRYPSSMESLLVHETAYAALISESVQDRVPEAYIQSLQKLRDEYAVQFFEATAERSSGIVGSTAYYLGD